MVLKHIDVGDAVYRMARIIQRQSSNSTSFTLSLGAIIGIACGGGVLIFGLLTFILMHFARRRHKRRRKATKRLILEDGDPEVVDAVRATRPPRLDLSGSYRHEEIDRPLRSAPAESGAYQEDDMNRGLLLPQPSYQVTGHRNSWPLVTPTPIAPTTIDTEISRPAQITTCKAEGSAQRWFDQQLPGIEMKTIPAPLKTPSPVRRNLTPSNNLEAHSASENHLSAILRSTSQRLRTIKPNLPRTTSALSQFSGPPPSSRVPSPEKSLGGNRLERMRESTAERETEYEESIRSSVLNMFSSPPSPVSGRRKSILDKKNLTTPTKKKRKSVAANDSDEDSLYGDTPEVAVSAYLTSPSKPLDKQHRAQVSSIDAQTTMISPHNRTSTQAFGGRDIFADRPKHGRIQSLDPFVEEPSTSSLKSTPMRPQIGGRQPTFGPTSASNSSMSVTYFPIHKISGNSSSPPRHRIDSDASDADPFRWDNRSQLVVKQSPNPQLPIVLGNRTSQRSNMVRISGLPHVQSASNIGETRERDLDVLPVSTYETNHGMNDPASPRISKQQDTDTARSQPKEQSSAPMIHVNDHGSLLEPPNLPHLLSLDDSPIHNGSDTNSANMNRHSAANSIFDYYANTTDSASEQPVHPPRLSSKKKTLYREISTPQFVFPSPGLPGLTPEEANTVPDSYFNEQQVQTPASFLNHSSSSLSVPTQASTISRVKGPQEKPHQAARESVQASVAALRRMNSTVSNYSNATSYVSDGSPTLPALRGGGISPTKEHQVKGNKNYMAVGRYTSNLAREAVAEEAHEVPSTLPELETKPVETKSLASMNSPKLVRHNDDRNETVSPARGRTMDRFANRIENQQAAQCGDYVTLPKLKHNSSLKNNASIPTPDQEFFDAVSSAHNSDVSPNDRQLPATPKKQMLSAHSRETSTQYDLARERELRNSGLKIQGLKLPLRDASGSPIKSFNENIFAVDAASHRAVELASQNAPYGNPGNFQNSGVKSNTDSMMSGLSTTAVVDVQTKVTPSTTDTRWSSQMPQPPPGMSANRPDSQSKFAQPLAVKANTAKWGSSWDTNETSPIKSVVSDHEFAAYSKISPKLDDNPYDKTYESESSSRLSPVARQVKHHAQKLAREKNAPKMTTHAVAGNQNEFKGKIVSVGKSKEKKKSWLKSPIGAKFPPAKATHTSFTPSGNADTFDWQKFMSRDGAATSVQQDNERKLNAVVAPLAEKPRLPSETHPALRDDNVLQSPPKYAIESSNKQYRMPLTPPEDQDNQPSPSILMQGSFMSPRAVPTPAPSHSRSLSQNQSAFSTHTRSESYVSGHTRSNSQHHTHSSEDMNDDNVREEAVMSRVQSPTALPSTRKASQSLRTGQPGRRGTAANIAKNLSPLQSPLPTAASRPHAPQTITTKLDTSKARLVQQNAASTTQKWAARNTTNHVFNSNINVQTKPEGFNTRMFEEIANDIKPTNNDGWIAATPSPSHQLSPGKMSLTSRYQDDGHRSKRTAKESEADFYDGSGFYRPTPVESKMGDII